MDSPPTVSPPPLPDRAETGKRCRFRPWLFFGSLAAPALVTLISPVLLGEDDGLGVAMVVALVGSIIAGLVCGIHFARSMSTLTPGAKIGVGIALVIGCAGGSFLLAFGGCALGAGMAGALH
ncbi:MAG: hypothetical protein KDN19_19495 [Verrucomicrobiae bacterium]|nr:hypothetical protein [Verrucomicrobiae bacterium]